MSTKNNQTIIKDKVKNINGIIQVEVKESFLLDVNEVLKADVINIEQFKEIYLELIVEINKKILENYLLPKDEREKDPLYKEYNNHLEIELEIKLEKEKIKKELFKFEFYFKYDKMKLLLVHFDRMIDGGRITKKRDLITPVLMGVILIGYIVFKQPEVSQLIPLIFLLLFNIGHIVLYFILIHCKKENKEIWVNKSSFDLFRKWFRARSMPDIHRIYFFVNWFNMWMLCLILLAVPNTNTKTINPVETVLVLIVVLLMAIFAIGYLLRVFSLNYWSTSLLTSFVLIAGFISKDNWAFVVLVFVIVNQIFSKDLIYLATDLDKRRKQGLEHYLDTFEGRENEIRLKFYTNVVISLLYLFLVIFNDSKILKPVLHFILSQFTDTNLSSFFLLGAERIIILFIVYFVVKHPKFPSYQIRERVQILINYIVSKLYRNTRESIPIFKDRLDLFENEQVEPIELIDNFEVLPSNVKVYWIKKPKWDSKGEELRVEVGVVYNDRSLYTHKSILNRKSLKD